VDIDAIEERAADFCNVALDDRRSAVALTGPVVEIAAGAGVHGGGEHEGGGEGEGHGGAGDGNVTVFERLAQDFENVAGKLGELVEEEDAVVGEGDFAGAGNGAAADEARVGDGVVRGAERPLGNESGFGVEDTGDGVDLGGLEGFVESEGREDRGETAGEHGFAGAGRADHQNVVTTGGGDLEGALGGLLAANVGEVEGEMLELVKDLSGFDFEGGCLNAAVAGLVEQVADLEEGLDGIDVDALDDGGFAGVGFGDDEVFDAALAGGDGDGQHAGNGAEGAVEAELADEEEVGEVAELERAVSAENADRHGEVEAGAFFFNVGGGEVDGDVGGGELEAGVADGGADAVTAFANGGVGKADRVEVVFLGLHAGEVHFDVDDAGIDAVNGGAEGGEEHGAGFCGESSSGKKGFSVMAAVRRGWEETEVMRVGRPGTCIFGVMRHEYRLTYSWAGNDDSCGTQPGDGDPACRGGSGARDGVGAVRAAASSGGNHLQGPRAFPRQPGGISRISGRSCQQSSGCSAVRLAGSEREL
jgi:hypothetical protein